ncbi:hypothetical protein CVIRNUC_001942 [Coccomyxa viridis]|uniref:NADH:ubiquinone reductase (non-electrogenic) n=1 Tax=Coccomyxa viridis TaxID=1274662 RepID=A0AAV1HUK6_9CHLO|nr:hypothetical protein CVIRNUC_001942 [Coccomyxa viridis]
MLNILRKRLTATLSASQPGLPGSASLVRVLCSRQSGASDQDAKPLRWAGLLGLTGALVTGAIALAPDADALQQEQKKTRVVVLGTGWGATSFLNALKPKHNAQYDIQVVSPRNYFLFSPLLPAAATGTVDTKSIVDPIRSHLDKSCNYYKAEALQINVKDKKVTCVYEKPTWRTCDLAGKDRVFDLDYDVLVVAVGAVTNTFNVPGVVGNCFFLKTAEDAKAIRERVNACFELANLPDSTEEDRKRLLSFVVAGGGPTGTELAAELNDLIHEDMMRYFPRVQASDISIRQIDSHDHILSAFDRSIAAYATDHFRRSGIDLILNCRIKAVEENRVVVLDQGSNELRQVPFGTCIWTTGIRMHPLSEKLAEQLQGEQEHWRSLKVDRRLMVKGTSDIFALGDAATIEQEKVFSHAEELFEEGDTNHDGNLSSAELQELLLKERKKYPQLIEIAARVPPNKLLNREDFKNALAELDKSLRSVPATAQVAHQQGHYLGKLFRQHHLDGSGLPEDAAEFKYNSKGSLAYIGSDKAVMDPGESMAFLKYVKGWFMGFGWKSAEIAMQASLKNQLAVMYDFMKTKMFGRDISDI